MEMFEKEKSLKSYFISSELLELSIDICSVSSFVFVFVFDDRTSSPHALSSKETASEC